MGQAPVSPCVSLLPEAPWESTLLELPDELSPVLLPLVLESDDVPVGLPVVVPSVELPIEPEVPEELVLPTSDAPEEVPVG